MSVLVADDNPDAADMLAFFLTEAGHTVHVAYDGRQAIELAKTVQPQVSVLDIGMPHASGLDVARWIRSQSWGRDRQLIALTGWGAEADKALTREAGFSAHVVKPADPFDIVRMLPSP